MEKNKLYLFPYGQDKCHTAYSFQIMYIFTQLLHYQDHMLFSSFYSLTLQNPKSPSCALAVLTSPGLPYHTQVCRVSASPRASTFACSGLLQDLVLCQEIFLDILGYSAPLIRLQVQLMLVIPVFQTQMKGTGEKDPCCSVPLPGLSGAQVWAAMAAHGILPAWFAAPVRSSHFLG